MNTKRIAIISTIGILILLIVSIIIFTTQQSADTPDHLLSLGEKYLAELNYEQALVQFLKVIEIDPMNPRGYTGAAEAYVGLGRMDDAVSVLQQGLDMTNDSHIRDMLSRINAESNKTTPFEPEEEETPLFDVPDDVRQIFDAMALAFEQNNRHTVEELMEHETLYTFMRENSSNDSLTAIYENHNQIIKISNIVYTYFPLNSSSNGSETCMINYVGFCTNGNGKYFRVFPSKHTYDEYGNWRGSQWVEFDLINFDATGEYRRTNYAQNGSIEREEYGNIVNWKYEGVVMSTDYRDGKIPISEDSYINGLMDGTYQDSPVRYSPFGSSDEYDTYIRYIRWPNL